MRILFTGGGTGGHFFPIIAIVRQLKQLFPPGQEEFLFIGPKTPNQEILLQEGIKIKTILAGKMRRYVSGYNFLDFFKLPIGLIQALWYIFWFMPDVCFAKGGYGSAPPVLVCWLFRIPVLIHESDAIPGAANKFLARFAKNIAISFSPTQNYFPTEKTALIGNPVRQEITLGSKEQGKVMFNLGDKPTILIIGGSQGAQKINEFILSILPQLLQKYEIIHQVGQDNYEKIKKTLEKELPGYHLFAFLDENQMKNAYGAADLVISRAGAGSIAEIAACAKPSILIPLPGAAAEHQKSNAYEYAKTGATVVVEQANLTPHLFLAEIEKLVSNPELLAKMSQAAKSFYRPRAARQIAEALIKIGR